MSTDTRDAIVATVTIVLGVSSIIGLLVRYALLPYLQLHLVKPVAEVRKQVTENSHRNAEPTVLDKLDDLATDVHTLSRVMDGHLQASDDWLTHINHELRQLHDGLAKMRGASPDERN